MNTTTTGRSRVCILWRGGHHVLCLRRSIPVWQNIGQSTNGTSRHRRNMTSDVLTQTTDFKSFKTFKLFFQRYPLIAAWGSNDRFHTAATLDATPHNPTRHSIPSLQRHRVGMSRMSLCFSLRLNAQSDATTHNLLLSLMRVLTILTIGNCMCFSFRGGYSNRLVDFRHIW